MLNRNNHAVIVRHGVCVELCNSAESRGGARWTRGAAAHPGRERTDSKRIRIRILRQLMNAMMAEVSNAQGRTDTKGLLQFQAPSLILRRVQRPCRGNHARRRESRRIDTRNRGLNLCKSLAGCEAIDKRRIGGCRILEQAGLFIRREIVPHDRVRIEEWGIRKERKKNIAWDRIIENAGSAAQDCLVRDAQRLPSETESR